MNDVKIDHDIPIPPKARREKWPIGQLEIGDSFFMPGGRSSRFGGFTNYWKARGRKLSVRTVTENGVKGLRVWRVE